MSEDRNVMKTAESKIPTVAELEELEEWAYQGWQRGRAPQNLHLRNLVGKLLYGYAGLMAMVSSPAYKRLTGIAQSMPIAEQIAQYEATK